MSKTCNNCGETKTPTSVPYAVLVDFKETAKANSLKWFVVCLVLIVLLVGSNIGWLVYESQYEDITETITQEVEQDADNGENYFVGGDMVGETEDKNNQGN